MVLHFMTFDPQRRPESRQQELGEAAVPGAAPGCSDCRGDSRNMYAFVYTYTVSALTEQNVHIYMYIYVYRYTHTHN